MIALYKTLLSLAIPVVGLGLSLSPKRRPLLARFRPRLPRLESRPIWVHACSVGEVNTARPILEALRARWPETPIVLTVSTPTGKALAEEMSCAQHVAWFPFDHPLVVHRFLRTLRPGLLVLIETELWPCVIEQTRASGAPVVLVNGRLSDAHAKSYERFSALYRPVIKLLSAAGMQNERYARRLVALGADPDTVTVTGNTKFDSAPERLSETQRTQLRETLGIAPAATVIVFGSTRPGDEEIAAKCWRTLKASDPGLVMIVAPRHLERVAEAREAFTGEPVSLRSSLPAGTSAVMGGRIIVLDTHGELSRVYAIATVAVVGGSFLPGVDGHNPIEPAAQGAPMLFGPHMRNFQDAADTLLARKGALQVGSPDALCGEMQQLLRDPEARERLRENALQAVAHNRGATARTLALIEKAFSPDSSPG